MTEREKRAARHGQARRILLLVLLANLLVAGVKIAVGCATRLQAVLADGFHSLTDSASNVIGLVGLRIAQKPADEDHSYGHSRYETLTSLAIVAMLAYLGIDILISSLKNLLHPDFRIPGTGELLLLAGTLAVNMAVAFFENRAGKRLGSAILRSDASHTASDVWVTCGVLTSVLLIRFVGAPSWVDSVVSCVIAGVIFRAAWKIFRQAADELTDHIAVDPEKIARVVLEDRDVQYIHKIRSRRSGETIFADFHVHCDPEMKLKEVHAMTHRVEARLNRELGLPIRCMIHTEDARGVQHAPSSDPEIKKHL